MSFRIAVIGAGPAGTHLSSLLSRQGHRVTLYEFRARNREKPCAGGLTPKLFSDTQIQERLSIPSRSVTSSRIISGRDTYVDFRLQKPVTVVSRKYFDRYLLETALKAGTRLINKRVKSIKRVHKGWLISAQGTSEQYDYVVGADGVNSVVRRHLSDKFEAYELYRTCGYFVKGLPENRIVIKFFQGLAGYAWVFPGREYVSVGICGTAHKHPVGHLKAKLTNFMSRHYSKEQLQDKRSFAWLIPSLPQASFSRLEISGHGWALVGDAAGLADPITGEGIYYAIRSSEILATCFSSNATDLYPDMVYQELAQNLIRAASLKKMFFASGFVENTVLLARASPEMQALLADLYSGAQDYVSLRRRLTTCFIPCMKDMFCQKRLGDLARAFFNIGQIVHERSR